MKKLFLICSLFAGALNAENIGSDTIKGMTHYSDISDNSLMPVENHYTIDTKYVINYVLSMLQLDKFFSLKDLKTRDGIEEKIFVSYSYDGFFSTTKIELPKRLINKLKRKIFFDWKKFKFISWKDKLEEIETSEIFVSDDDIIISWLDMDLLENEANSLLQRYKSLDWRHKETQKKSEHLRQIIKSCECVYTKTDVVLTYRIGK